MLTKEINKSVKIMKKHKIMNIYKMKVERFMHFYSDKYIGFQSKKEWN